ncbi:DUF1643 domain-containing protein [Microbacteriaceae bacterium 4G12]
MGSYSWEKDENVTCIFDKRNSNRYLLKCLWNNSLSTVTFILCNPSEGNELNADFTLRRCVNFSKDWGYGCVIVVNLFSQVTKNPKDLVKPSKQEVEENNKYITQAVSESKLVVFGWGEIEKAYKTRVNEVKQLVPMHKQFYIKKAANGHYPRHPSRLPSELKPIAWNEN